MNAVLAGYGNIPTGLGSELRWLWKLLPFSVWIQHRHKKFEKTLGYGDQVPWCDGRRIAQLDWHATAKRADVVVCVERPLPDSIDQLCARFKVPLVVLCNAEWTRRDSPWLKNTSLCVARTNQCERHLKKIGVEKVVRLQVPIDLEEFPFTPRTKVEVVRFSGGWGGVHERKGTPEVRAMADAYPGLVEVYSQRPLGYGQGAVARSADLYEGADVMLVPSRFEGVGLAVLEAMAAGCVVMATDAEPMSEFLRAAYGGLADICLLPVGTQEIVNVGGQEWTASMVDPLGSAAKLFALKLGMPSGVIRELSERGRAYIEANHGPIAASRLWEAIQGVHQNG